MTSRSKRRWGIALGLLGVGMALAPLALTERVDVSAFFLTPLGLMVAMAGADLVRRSRSGRSRSGKA